MSPKLEKPPNCPAPPAWWNIVEQTKSSIAVALISPKTTAREMRTDGSAKRYNGEKNRSNEFDVARKEFHRQRSLDNGGQHRSLTYLKPMAHSDFPLWEKRSVILHQAPCVLAPHLSLSRNVNKWEMENLSSQPAVGPVACKSGKSWIIKHAKRSYFN